MPTQPLNKTFSKGKQNRDNDPRVIQPGEYIQLINGRIARSEGDGVGSLENTLGNESVSTFVDATAVVLGSVRDIAEDRIYYFVKGSEEDAVYEFNQRTERAIPLLRDDRGILNFSVDNLITSARIIGTSDPGDEQETLSSNIRSQKLLLWTDNLNPPRKINVNRARLRFDGELNNFTESEISLEKAPPLFAPQTSEVYLNVDPETADEATLNTFLRDEDLDLSLTRKREEVTLIIEALDLEENLKEKFPRFAYRFRYEDNEYSAFSPFSPAMFRPGTFSFDQDTGSIDGMENQMKAVDISFNTGGSDVTEIELLYKDANNNVVYVVEGFNKSDRGWRDNVDLSILNELERPVRFATQKLYRALPDSQLLRVYDDVPLRAKTMEIVDNRVMFGNYQNQYDLLDVRKQYDNEGNLQQTFEEEITVDFNARISRPEEIGQEGDVIQPGVGEPTLKSDRDYELGIVYLDNLGRQTPVLTSQNNSVRVNVERANKRNRLSVDINSKAPEFATHYRFFVKDTRPTPHYNLIPLETQVQPDDDAFRWFRFADTDQEKVKEGDHLILKVNMGMFAYGDDSNTGKVTVRVEEAGIRGRNFLEVNDPRTGRVTSTDDEGNLTEVIDEGEIYTAQRPGFWVKIKNTSLIPPEEEQPATSSKSFARSNNARNANFRPIKGLPAADNWKDFTYYYQGNISGDEALDETAVTFSAGSTWTPGTGLGADITGLSASPKFGPMVADTDEGYSPMRVEVEIQENNKFSLRWWLSPSVEDPAVVVGNAEGDIVKSTAITLVNGVTVTFPLDLTDYVQGDRWVATYRTSTNFMWRCWKKSDGNPNGAARRSINSRRSHVMLYGPGVLEQGINGNSMLQFGVEDGLDRRLSGNAIAFPFSRNNYYTEDVFYETFEEWLFEEGYWSSGGEENLEGTARDGERLGIHQLGFYRGLPVTPNNDADLAAIVGSLAGGAGIGVAVGAGLTGGPLLLAISALNPVFSLGGLVVGALLQALVGGKTTEDYWRLRTSDSTDLLMEGTGNDADGESFPLYCFVQSGTYNDKGNKKKAEKRQNANFAFYQGNGASEDDINMLNICFETIPEESELDVFYEIGDTFTCLNGVHFGNDMSYSQKITYIDPTTGEETQNAFRESGRMGEAGGLERLPNTETDKIDSITVNLDYFNCFAWNNGVEVKAIRDEVASNSLDLGAKASTVVDNYQEASNFSSIIFSEPFNEQAGVNGLNEFSSTRVALGQNRKEMDELDGSIQHLFSKDTNLVVFQEDKISQVLVNKDQLLNADGTSNISSTNAVLGQEQGYAGEYGISQNPESFAVYGNRLYFADANRGVICRLGQSGIEEISNFGMRDFFREELGHNYGTTNEPIAPIVIGQYDDYHDQYLVSIREPLADPASPRIELPLLISKQAFLSRTDACRFPEEDLQYTQVYEFFTPGEIEGFQVGDIVYYDRDRTSVFHGDNDWFVWFENVNDVDYTANGSSTSADGVYTQTFRYADSFRSLGNPLVGQELTLAHREGSNLEYQVFVSEFDATTQDITVRFDTPPTEAIEMMDPVEFYAQYKFVINIDNFGIVRAKEDCHGVLPISHDAFRVSIASYNSPEQACAKGIVARMLYHDGNDPTPDIGDSIYDSPYGADEYIMDDGTLVTGIFANLNYFKGRTQKRGWYQYFDGANLEDYVLNIVQGKVVDIIRCDEIAAGRKRVLTTSNPVQRNEGENDDQLATRVCAILPIEVSFHNGENASPVIGDSIYRDGFTNSPLAEGYYALDGGFIIRVIEGGLIAEKRLCAITICVDDVVRAQLLENQDQEVNLWNFTGIGSDTRNLPTVTMSTPTLGSDVDGFDGSINLNGAITSFGQFTSLEYSWYYLRDQGEVPTERELIDQGILVAGGTAGTIGGVSQVNIPDLQAFTTYYAMFLVTIGGTIVTSDVLPVTLSRSNTPSVTITRTDTSAVEPGIGDTVTFETTVMADATDTWTQKWYKTVDGVDTEVFADSVTYTATSAEGDAGSTYTFTLALEPSPNEGIRNVDYFTTAEFSGPLFVDSNTIRVRRAADTDRVGAFSDVSPPVTRTTAHQDLGNFDTQVISSAYGDNVPAGDFMTSQVISGENYTQTQTVVDTTYNDQIETQTMATCIAADGCTYVDVDGSTQNVLLNEIVFDYRISTPSVATEQNPVDETRTAVGTSPMDTFDGGAEEADSRTGGVVGAFVFEDCTDYAPDPLTIPEGAVFTQTRTCTYSRTTSATDATFLYTCLSPDWLGTDPGGDGQQPAGTAGCTLVPSGGTDAGSGDYTIIQEVIAESEETVTGTQAELTAAGVPNPMETEQQNTGTMPAAVNGTAAFSGITTSGLVNGGSGGTFQGSNFGAYSPATAANSQVQVMQSSVAGTCVEIFTGAVQDGRRTCQQVTAPSGGGNPGTCSGSPFSSSTFAIGQTQIIEDHFTGLTRTVPVSASAGGSSCTMTQSVNNPAYAACTTNPGSLSWSDSQGTGVDMGLSYTANSHKSGTIWNASVPGAWSASPTSGGNTMGTGTITLTRESDSTHSGTFSLTVDAQNGEQVTCSTSLSATEVASGGVVLTSTGDCTTGLGSGTNDGCGYTFSGTTGINHAHNVEFNFTVALPFDVCITKGGGVDTSFTYCPSDASGNILPGDCVIYNPSNLDSC